MNLKKYLTELSPHHFWNVERDELDAFESRDFIIQRAFECGTTTDWKTTLAFYGSEQIVQTALNCRYLETKAMDFISRMFNVKLEDFRCYNFKQLDQNFWPC